MKLIYLLSFATILNAFGSEVYSQYTKLNLKMDDAPIHEVLSAIENQSEFFFMYSSKMIDVSKTVDISANDRNINEVLDELLTNTDIHYDIKDRQILLVNKENNANELFQQNFVSGTVIGKDGEPLPGVNVLIKGTTIGTITDVDGKYSIPVTNANVTLVFSFIGYTSLEIPVEGKSVVNATLEDETELLSEVVVIGYGTARKKDLTGAVTSVRVDDLSQNVVVSPGGLFQDKVVGMEVTNISGAPGAAPTIQIRGTSSIRASNNPLYVVDGVPLTGISISPNMSNAFGTTPYSDPLLFINSNDIVQIDVLKDASSTAIYGSRGANGVIIITTKKGAVGPMKLDVGFNSSLNAGYMKRYDILSPSEFRSALSENLSETIASEYDYGDNVDALKEITQNKLSQNYSFALSGGNENGRFRASFLASNNYGFIKNSGLNKYLGSFNGTYSFFEKKLTLDFNVSTAKYKNEGVSIGQTSGNNGNLLIAALEWNPTRPFYKEDGTFNYPTTGGSGHPNAFSEAYYDESNVTEVLSTFSAAYKITSHITYKFLYGLNYGSGIREISTDGWLPNFLTVSGLGTAAINNQVLNAQVLSHTISYQNDIMEGLNLEGLLGYEYSKNDLNGASVTATTFNTNLVYADRINIPYTKTMQNAKVQNPYTTWANPTSELQSFFGRATLNYFDRYLLTGTLRADGSSKFGENNKYGYFPSVGFKWQISNENFMQDNPLFSNLSLRLSYGITGNQEFPAGSSQEQFSLTAYNNLPQSVNGNPNLKWETSRQFNAGIDFTLRKGNFWGSIDYYKKNTSDILFQTIAIQPAPSSSTFMNLPDAVLTNEGAELALGTNLIDNSKIHWEVAANLAYNSNTISDFTDPNTGLDLLIKTGTLSGQGLSGTLAQVITNNKPVNTYYLKKFIGFDENGNQLVEPTPGFAGDPNPHYLLGINTSFRYDKFTFGIRMGGAFDYLIYNTTRTAITNMAGLAMGRNIDKAAFDSDEGAGSGVAASTRFLENGDYMKLRNASISYNLGNVGKYIKNLNAYISGNNLFVITKFTGFDPEVNVNEASGGYPSRSIEYVPYPTARSISFGFNFSL